MKYNRSGEEYKQGKDKIVFAEVLEGSRQTVYTVITYNNTLYDPLGADSNRESKLTLALKRTSKKTFDAYIKYLKTNNRIFITKAQRSFIDG
tara:strand:- start:61 stop:336 length:276 start_codon:yes stop_codon:yes gene_type:complete